MRASKTGAALVAVYMALSVAIWVYAASISGDPKGAYVIAQLPFMFAHAAALEMEILPILDRLPDIVVICILFAITILVLYVFGWVIGWIGHLLFGRHRPAQ
ncbi:hypothetical protein IPV08_23180 [Methylobacterium sp. SD274]|uniref:hypothetical protein n=1 Tax=Methylobacterium sp. SD274 TaxID=2782009 RepID=UPI001A969BA9|nr:hypothetical protein [Methylobacterium sp. SD274]MBO1022866.1 hypothetical protein [Methylobacterium sp. SD274]